MEKDLLTGLLEKAYNKSPEEISELLYEKSEDSEEVKLKESAIDLVLDLDEQRVNNLKSSVKPDKETLQQIHDRALKESREEFEKQLRAKYSIESSSKGLDLVQEIIDQVSDCDISEDKIKQQPAYLELEDRKNQEIEALRQEHEEFKLNQDRRTRLSRVNEDVLNIFASLNPIESENTTVATNRRKDYLRKFEDYDFEIQEDGNHFVKKDGKRVEDRHGNPIKFNEFVKEKTMQNYDLAQSGDKGNAGNQGGNGSGGRTDVPKTEKEFLSRYTELKLQGKIEESVALATAWSQSQKS